MLEDSLRQLTTKASSSPPPPTPTRVQKMRTKQLLTPVSCHFVGQIKCPHATSFLFVIGRAEFLYLCVQKKKLPQDLHLCCLSLPPLLSKKTSAFPSSYCLKDFFFFQNESIFFHSHVSLIFSFRENVELLLSASGYEGVILHWSTEDKGINVCWSSSHDQQLGNCFRRCYWQLTHCLVEFISFIFFLQNFADF